jgi:hypothetical protein
LSTCDDRRLIGAFSEDDLTTQLRTEAAPPAERSAIDSDGARVIVAAGDCTKSVPSRHGDQ